MHRCKLFTCFCKSDASQIFAADPIKKIAREIAKANVYEFAAAPTADRKSTDQNNRYEVLLKTAGDADLIELATKNKNAIVRLYAYRAIVQKFKEVPKNILDQFANDQTMVSTMRGAIEEKMTVSKIAESFLY